MEAQNYFVKAYTSEEHSNEEYHSDEEYATGSILWALLENSPAGWRYRMDEEKRKEVTLRQKRQNPLDFGTSGHAVLLEPQRFNDEFYRMPSQEDFKDLLTSDQAMRGWLKERGIKGYSSMKTPELIAAIRSAGDGGRVNIWAEIFENAQKEAGNRIQVPGEEFDKVLTMREVIMSNGDYADIINNGQPEISIYCVIDGVKVKVRIDYVTPKGGLLDYKTTVSARPDLFGIQCVRMGYYLKMALQHDCFKLAYGHAPYKTSLLAQEKEYPYLCLMHNLTPPQLAVGRMLYKTALQLLAACQRANSWPSYANGKSEVDLETPVWFKAKFKHIFDEYEKGEK